VSYLAIYNSWHRNHRIVDFDTIELHNLHQILYTGYVGQSKAITAKSVLKQMITVIAFEKN
jgi:molybdopterin/thiamine biosynthesis adenylyltransferase